MGSGLVLPALIRRLRDQRALAAVSSALLLTGTICLLFAPQWGLLCSVVAGLAAKAASSLR